MIFILAIVAVIVLAAVSTFSYYSGVSDGRQSMTPFLGIPASQLVITPKMMVHLDRLTLQNIVSTAVELRVEKGNTLSLTPRGIKSLNMRTAESRDSLISAMRFLGVEGLEEA